MHQQISEISNAAFSANKDATLAIKLYVLSLYKRHKRAYDLDLHTSTIGWWCHRLRHQRHCHPHAVPSAYCEIHYGTEGAIRSGIIPKEKGRIAEAVGTAISDNIK